MGSKSKEITHITETGAGLWLAGIFPAQAKRLPPMGASKKWS